MTTTDDAPLLGVRVVSIAINLPGPVAAARLSGMGASVVKVEPPSGDPLGMFVKAYYDELVAGQRVEVLDLKLESGRAALEVLLDDADVLITSSRPAALSRLGLGWSAVHQRYPQLSQVAIVGSPAPDDDVAGHDLVYQAINGMLSPPAMPTVLVADLAGAERAVSEALAALVARNRTGEGSFREVALATAARDMAAPIRHGLTPPNGPLGGALPAYGIYPAADGFVALAALEPHFAARLVDLLGVECTRAGLERVFATRTASGWQAWARDHDVPLAAVVDPAEQAPG